MKTMSVVFPSYIEEMSYHTEPSEEMSYHTEPSEEMSYHTEPSEEMSYHTEPSEEMSYYTEPSDHYPIVVSQMIKRLISHPLTSK